MDFDANGDIGRAMGESRNWQIARTALQRADDAMILIEKQAELLAVLGDIVVRLAKHTGLPKNEPTGG